MKTFILLLGSFVLQVDTTKFCRQSNFLKGTFVLRMIFFQRFHSSISDKIDKRDPKLTVIVHFFVYYLIRCEK